MSSTCQHHLRIFSTLTPILFGEGAIFVLRAKINLKTAKTMLFRILFRRMGAIALFTHPPNYATVPNTSESTNFSKFPCFVFQPPLVHIFRSGLLLFFLLNSFYVDSDFLRTHFDEDKDNAKTTKGKTRLINYVFSDAKPF